MTKRLTQVPLPRRDVEEDEDPASRVRVRRDFATVLAEQYRAGEIDKAQFVELIIQNTAAKFSHALTAQQRADCEEFLRTSLSDPMDPALKALLGDL